MLRWITELVCVVQLISRSFRESWEMQHWSGSCFDISIFESHSALAIHGRFSYPSATKGSEKCFPLNKNSIHIKKSINFMRSELQNDFLTTSLNPLRSLQQWNPNITG